jgi:UDP-N-acetylglucosamine 2-epimerase (non-hydrolysing)
MKVLVLMGTRPEVIKLAPVVRLLEREMETVVCATGQHREMLQQALDVFGLSPRRFFEAMAPGRSLNILTSRLMAELDEVFETEKPDWVLVQGDTTSAFCGALAAFHRNIRVGHVEAGLRTGDLTSPFPEEANRTLLGRIATAHFAPTIAAKDNLLSEGTASASIHVTGNTVVDAIELVRTGWMNHAPARLPEAISSIASDGKIALITSHRRENFGEVMRGFCRTIGRLCRDYPNIHWIFPVHLNPNAREPVMAMLGGIANLSLVEPVDYQTSLYLLSRSELALTDSGGIQEEAPTFGVPVVVMRTHTERGEGVKAGFATLAGQDERAIEQAVRAWLDDPGRRKSLREARNPYGDGRASERIAAFLVGRPVDEFRG